MDQKRTLDEVNTLYALEPDVCDVYVEGPTDKYFLDWYLRRKGFSNVTVYPIEVVDIPRDVVTAYCPSARCNRSKVVALSCELSRQQTQKRRVMCVIDRDSNDATWGSIVNPYLYATDGNSLELYAFTPTVMEKFLLVALAGFPINAESLIQKVGAVLESVFAIRQANERMSFGMEWIPFSSYVQVNAYHIAFRESDFIHAYLQKNSKWQHRAKFLAAKNDIQRSLSSDVSKRMRGHDLSELLHLIVRKFRKDRAFSSSAALEGCLMASIESSDLEAYPLFIALEKHAAAIQ